MSAHDGTGYASYEQRWLAAQPHNAIVAVFLPEPLRARAAAFGTLVHELADTAFSAREAQAAAAKLAWWQQELHDAAQGRARHPIAQALFADAAIRALDVQLWPAIAAGAAAQIDAPGAGTLTQSRAQLAALHRPVAQAQAALLGVADADSEHDATLWSVAHWLDSVPTLRPDMARLPLPLDLLARHGLARPDLAHASPQRNALLRDWLEQLAELHRAARSAGRPRAVPLRVRARLDANRIAVALRAPDALAWLQSRPQPGRWESLWAAWREARAAALG